MNDKLETCQDTDLGPIAKPTPAISCPLLTAHPAKPGICPSPRCCRRPLPAHQVEATLHLATTSMPLLILIPP